MRHLWGYLNIPEGAGEMFGDTKVEIIIRLSNKDRQYSYQKKKNKRTNNDLQNIHIKLKIEKHEPN